MGHEYLLKYDKYHRAQLTLTPSEIEQIRIDDVERPGLLFRWYPHLNTEEKPMTKKADEWTLVEGKSANKKGARSGKNPSGTHGTK
jgi:hypothetical protein